MFKKKALKIRKKQNEYKDNIVFFWNFFSWRYLHSFLNEISDDIFSITYQKSMLYAELIFFNVFYFFFKTKVIWNLEIFFNDWWGGKCYKKSKTHDLLKIIAQAEEYLLQNWRGRANLKKKIFFQNTESIFSYK